MLQEKRFSIDGGNTGNIWLDKNNNLLPIDINFSRGGNLLGDLLLPFFQFKINSSLDKSTEVLIEKLFNAEKKYPFFTGMRDEAMDYLLDRSGVDIVNKLNENLNSPSIREKMNQAARESLGLKPRS